MPQGDNEILWGESTEEQSVPKVLKRYKNSSSKRRVTRDLGYNAPIDDEEKAEIERIKNFSGKSLKSLFQTDYARELFGDVMQLARQTQKVDARDKELGQKGSNIDALLKETSMSGEGKGLLKARLKRSGFSDNVMREVGYSYTPETGFKSYIGDPFDAQNFIKTGVLGSVSNMPYPQNALFNYEKSKIATSDMGEGFGIHFHPGALLGNVLPSDEDKVLGALYGNNFIVGENNKVVNFNKDKEKLLKGTMQWSYR